MKCDLNTLSKQYLTCLLDQYFYDDFSSPFVIIFHQYIHAENPNFHIQVQILILT